MKLKRQAIRGLTVFKEEQVISYDDLPEGLIAIVGRNGEGKTTLLDSIFAVLFRKFPTRSSNLCEYLNSGTGSISLGFEMHGKAYEATLLLDGRSDAQSAYLVSGDTPISKTGKVREYDKAIADVVGTPQLLLSSVFNCQTHDGSLLAMPVSERKALFIEMLGLGRHPAISKESSDRAADKLKNIGAMQTRRAFLAKTISGKSALQDNRSRQTVAALAALEVIAETRVNRSVLQESLAESNSRAREMEGLKSTCNELAVRRASYAQAEAGVKEQRDRHAMKLKAESDVLAARLAAINTSKATSQTQIDEIFAVLSRRQEIEDGVRSRIALHDKAKELNDELSAAVDAERNVRDQMKMRTGLESSQRDVVKSIKYCMTEIAELDTIPCEGKPPYNRCPKIVRAVDARTELPSLRDLLRETERQLGIMPVIVSNLRAPEAIRAEMSRTWEAYEATERYIPLQGILNDAGRQQDDCRKRIEEFDGQEREAKARIQAIADGLDDMVNAYTTRFQEIVREKAAVSIQLQEAEERLREAAKGHVDVEALTHLLGRADKLIAESEHDAAWAQAEIELIEKSLAAIAVDEGERDVLDGELLVLERNQSEWQMLAKAFGPNGIAALEIDAAGPSISALANDLLSACFANRFTLKLATQRESADGSKLIEDFAVRVFDSVRQRECKVEDLSGGQQVIVGEALGIAIALYNKGTHRLETLFRDETTGALDWETAPLYVDMLRRALKIGNFSRALFITHNPTVSDLADARLRCANGAITVEL